MNWIVKPANRVATCVVIGLVVLAVFAVPSALAQRTRLKPGRSLFSPQQEVEMGKQVAQDAEKKLAMLNNQRVDDYLSRLGKKLATVAPYEKYPYQFRCVNDSSINAFALPGGFLFINRGTIEAADNEAELAGVVGHEIGHVALRHGASQATKTYIAQVPAAILGILMGGNSAAAIAAQIGASFGTNSILLKYSREDERQADLMGAQILYDTNYDPRFCAQFFEKLETKGRGTDFFSSHPNPENRIKNIKNEIGRLGPISSNTVNDTNEFRNIQKLLKSLPPAPKAAEAQSQDPSTGQVRRPTRPSTKFQIYSNGNLSLRHPDNWKAYQSGNNFSLAPDGGIVKGRNGSALAYGVVMEIFAPNTGGRSSISLKEATDQLIEDLRRSNSRISLTDQQERIRVGGKAALSRILNNDSPVGGKEIDWLVTVLRPEGLVYFVFVAPEQEFSDYQQSFQQVLDSVRFNDQ